MVSFNGMSFFESVTALFFLTAQLVIKNKNEAQRLIFMM
jgi:hypothetical protein